MRTESSPHLSGAWMPWLRVGWGVAAAISLLTFAGTLVLMQQFVDAPPPRIVEGLTALGWSDRAYLSMVVANGVVLYAVFFATGAGVFWLRQHDPMALFTSVFLMAFGASLAGAPAEEFTTFVVNASPLYFIPAFISGMLSFGMLGAFFATFPDGRVVPKWMRWTALVSFLYSLAWYVAPVAVRGFSGPGGVALLAAALFAFGGSLAGQVWRFRNHATPLQKQQTKLFLFGLALLVGFGTVPYVLWSLFSAEDPKSRILADLFVGVVSNLAFILLPVTIAVAILRYRLWDIDVVIRKTLVYSLLTGSLALIYFSSIALMQGFITAASSQSSAVVIVLSTLAIAALFTPLRRRIQDAIDRRFYRRKYDAEQVLARFAQTARDETDLDSLTTELARVVQETMQPERVSVWLKENARE